MIVTNANTPSGTRALLSADLAEPFGVTADTGPLAVSLPGGGNEAMTGTLASSNGKAITVTAKIAKVYSPTVDLAMPMGRKPAAVMSVPVNIGMAVTSYAKVAARTRS